MAGLSGVQLERVDSVDKAMDLKRWLGERRSALAFDTETSGLNPYAPDAKIRLIQFGDTQTGWAVDWDMWKGLALEVLRSWDGRWVAHNLPFDQKWIEHHSDFRFPTHLCDDTMLQAHVVDPLGPGGLKPLAGRMIDPRAVQGEQALHEAMAKNKWTWATVPTDFDSYWIYGALDPVLTSKLDEAFAPKVGPEGPWRGVYDLEIGVRHVITRMEQRGARIDPEYATAQSTEQIEYANRLLDWGQTVHGIGLGSNKQLAARFIELGVTFDVFSERTGEPKMDKYQLRLLANHPDPVVAELAQAVLWMRKARKYGGDYFRKFVQSAVTEDDGQIIHAQIKSTGARTSRMSIGDPPLQQIPKGDATVRRVFIAREGNKIIATDYSQIEMRLMAHFSDDADLQKAFIDADATGGDFFVGMGREIYQEPDFAKSDPRRGLMKNTLYGKIYGAGVAKMAESAGVPYGQMEDVVKGIERRFPGIKTFMKRIEDIGVKRERATGQGFVETPFGRRLPADSDRLYTLVNYLIQGHAAEVFKRALIHLDSYGYGPYMLLPVHDEIVMDIPEEHVQQALRDVPMIMSDRENYAVPILAESEGPFDNWGQKYEKTA